MEYKTISEIRELSFNSYGNSNIDNYSRALIRNEGWGEREIRLILEELRCPHVENYLPIDTEFVFEYVKTYLCENFENISYWVLHKRFCTEDIRVVKFTINSSENSHCIFCHPEDAMNIDHALNMLSASIPYHAENTIQELEQLEEFTQHRAYLAHLGLIPMTEEELANSVIPQISDTHTIDEGTSRFSSAIWYDEIQTKEITLAGLGGIGSWTALLLGRVKPCRLYLYDDDVVEFANMAGQLYCSDDIGKSKVDATASNLIKFATYNSIVAFRERYTEQTQATDIMICGFDNMIARAIFFKNWLNHVKSKPEEERRHCLFIDGRLAAEELQVFCIVGNDTKNINRYAHDFIFKDEEASETLCSYKQTTYMANMIAGFIVNLFTNFVADEICEGIRDIPFLTSYVGDTMVSKIEF